jgi:hypothetical protein
MQAMFAGAAAVATLTLLNAAPPVGAGTALTSGSRVLQALPSGTGGSVVAVDDDTNPSSGDIFTQNAQDQSTA